MNTMRETNLHPEHATSHSAGQLGVAGDHYGGLSLGEIDRAKARMQVEIESLVRNVIDTVSRDCGASLGDPPKYPEVRIIVGPALGYRACGNILELTEEMAACAATLGHEIGEWMTCQLQPQQAPEMGRPPGRLDVVYRNALGRLIATAVNEQKGVSVQNSKDVETAPFAQVLKPPVARHFSELIGNTPLVLLQAPEDLNPETRVWGKLESYNPGGSVKDRTALAMILDAERKGLLTPGSTIVESTSGNLGHALAMLARSRGYHYVAVVDSKTPADNLNLFKLLDVEVVVVDEKDEYGSTQKNRMLRAQEIARDRPGCVNLNQYRNEAARLIHYNTTGPEIYQQLQGRLDVLVGTVGTGSHLCGTAKFLKEKIPGLRVIGVEPVGSILFGGTPAPYLQNGNGSVFIPDNFDPNVLDIQVKASDANAMNTVRAVARANGMFFGGSSGAALYGAFAHAKASSIPLNIVVLLPDGGSKYMSTVYNDEWMIQRGLMDTAVKKPPFCGSRIQ